MHCSVVHRCFTAALLAGPITQYRYFEKRPEPRGCDSLQPGRTDQARCRQLKWTFLKLFALSPGLLHWLAIGQRCAQRLRFQRGDQDEGANVTVAAVETRVDAAAAVFSEVGNIFPFQEERTKIDCWLLLIISAWGYFVWNSALNRSDCFVWIDRKSVV